MIVDDDIVDDDIVDVVVIVVFVFMVVGFGLRWWYGTCIHQQMVFFRGQMERMKNGNENPWNAPIITDRSEPHVIVALMNIITRH